MVHCVLRHCYAALIALSLALTFSDGLMSSYYQLRLAEKIDCPEAGRCKQLRLTATWQRLCRQVICDYHQNIAPVNSNVRDMRADASLLSKVDALSPDMDDYSSMQDELYPMEDPTVELMMKKEEKRHWGNAVVICVKNRCGDKLGKEKLKCVIERCHKALSEEEEKDKE